MSRYYALLLFTAVLALGLLLLGHAVACLSARQAWAAGALIVLGLAALRFLPGFL